jgi:hypothetical protein
MSITLRFDDHPGFHREVLAGVAGAVVVGAGWSLVSSSPWAALQGGAAGLAIGLGAVRGSARALQTGLGLVAVAAGLLAVHLGAGLWGRRSRACRRWWWPGCRPRPSGWRAGWRWRRGT